MADTGDEGSGSTAENPDDGIMKIANTRARRRIPHDHRPIPIIIKEEVDEDQGNKIEEIEEESHSEPSHPINTIHMEDGLILTLPAESCREDGHVVCSQCRVNSQPFEPILFPEIMDESESASSVPNWRKDKCLKDIMKYALEHDDDTFKDVTFLVGPDQEPISAHRSYLGIISPTFAHVFFKHPTLREEKRHLNLLLPDTLPSSFRLLLRHIYAQPVELDTVEALELLKLCYTFKVSDLLVKCMSQLITGLNSSNAAEILQVAWGLPDPRLKECALALIASNPKAVFETPGFLALELDHLCDILQRDLNLDEVSIFLEVKRWAEHSVRKKNLTGQNVKMTGEDIRKELDKALFLIRFPLFTGPEFCQHVSKCQILTLEEAYKVLEAIVQGHDHSSGLPFSSEPRSIFDRSHQDRDRRRSRSRSLSRSPPRKLVSTIGTIINRTEDYESVRPVVSSVIRVTDRPKRDLKANNKLLFMAVADAQKSIIQSEQSSTKVAEAKKRKSENEDQPVISKRRFTGLTEATSEEFNENQDSNIRRKSVKERLGVKRDVRKSVKERLGIIPSQGFGEMSNDSFDGYNQEDYSIVVNVNDEGGNITGRRNVTLASAVPEFDFSKINRISIQVNNSEEDDTSDDSSDDEAERLSKSKRLLESMDHSNVSDDDKVCVSIDDDDKLPEIPESETEYVVEEIELDESSMMADLKESPKDVSSCEEVQQPPNANAAANENSSEAQKLTSFLSSVEKTELTNPPSSTQYSLPSALPDLRGRLANTSQSAKSAPVTAGTKPKCKFWPSCQFKDSCTFEHPMCRYNASCTNPQCFYRHENKEDSQKKEVCKFYPKCTSMKCKFLHPSPCRFGVGCTDFKCSNYHPGPTIGMHKLKAKGVTVIPSSYQLQWTKSKA